jgi:hypothetical protein
MDKQTFLRSVTPRARDPRWRRSAAILFMAAGLALAHEDPSTMISTEELAENEPPGPWQGNWSLTRIDPRLTTRGAQDLMSLHVIQSAGEPEASVQWVAHRAICPDPFDAPCEWIGASGEATGTVDEGGLYLVLKLSADPDDPFVLHLRPDGGGLLFSRSGGLRMTLDYRRDRDER